jgi:hypothetical protein
MSRLRSLASAVAAGLTLTAGGTASAGDFLHSLGCGTPAQVIQLPAQNIVVETSRPRVHLEDTTPTVGKHGKRARFDTPFVATILAPVGPAPSGADRAPDSLSLAHQVEYNLMLLHRAQAAQEAERQATQRALDRVSTALRDTAPAGGGDPSLAAQIKNLNDRLDRLEKLVKIQGAVLKEQVDPEKK